MSRLQHGVDVGGSSTCSNSVDGVRSPRTAAIILVGGEVEGSSHSGDDGGGASFSKASPRRTVSLIAVLIVTGAALMFYFVTSIALTVFNKWLFTETPKVSTTLSSNATSGVGAPSQQQHGAGKRPLLTSSYGFHYPLTVTCVHQFQVFLMVLAAGRIPWLTRRMGAIEKSRSALLTLAPIGALCGLDWGLSNTSMRSIPLSLYEMVKSSTPVVVLIFSFRIGLASITLPLVLIILVISTGLFLSVSGGNVAIFRQADFPFKGFVAVSVATLLSGTRVVLTQFALQRGGLETVWRQLLPSSITARLLGSASAAGPPATAASASSCSPSLVAGSSGGGSHSRVQLHTATGLTATAAGTAAAAAVVASTAPSSSPSVSQSGGGGGGAGSHGGFNTMTALYYSAPASAIALVLPALVFEGRDVARWFQSASVAHQYEVTLWVCLSSAVAFLLTVAEFTITGLTSALTMCVTGIAKQIIIVAIAMVLFGERLGRVNAIGFGMSIVGICFYNYLKYKQHHAQNAGKGYAAVPAAAEVEPSGSSSAVFGKDATIGVEMKPISPVTR